MSADSDDDRQLAERAAAAMYERDRAARGLGIEIEEVRPGYARCAFSVSASMLNGHDLCHGGFIFLLADTAFAYACNSRNEAHVALQCSISFATAAREGERLSAVAQERARTRRTGTYDVAVERAGTVVALFRGTSFSLNAPVIRADRHQAGSPTKGKEAADGA